MLKIFFVAYGIALIIAGMFSIREARKERMSKK